MTKTAFTLRRYRSGDERVAKGQVVRGMADNQFEDFRLAGLVREATADEAADAPAQPKTFKPRAKPRARKNTA
jgi:hypothetical protein